MPRGCWGPSRAPGSATSYLLSHTPAHTDYYRRRHDFQ
uniref:Uncharacterized protein n=1 Tax=Setaria italica TaxID=4555 RepID=K3Y439_SETIT